MRRITLLIFINLILALFQYAFFPDLTNKWSVPNLVFSFGAFLMLTNRWDLGLISVLTGGVFLDILSNTDRFGLSALILTTGLYIILLLRKYVFKGFLFNTAGIIIVSIVYTQLVVFRSAQLELPALLSAILTTILTMIMVVLSRYEKKSY